MASHLVFYIRARTSSPASRVTDDVTNFMAQEAEAGQGDESPITLPLRLRSSDPLLLRPQTPGSLEC